MTAKRTGLVLGSVLAISVVLLGRVEQPTAQEHGAPLGADEVREKRDTAAQNRDEHHPIVVVGREAGRQTGHDIPDGPLIEEDLRFAHGAMSRPSARRTSDARIAAP